MASNKKIIFTIVLVVLAIISVVISGPLSQPETYKNSIEYLDEQDNISRNMIVVTAGSSIAVSAIPDDIGTPIANKLADISGYFAIALGAVMLEKYLLTIIGLIVYKFVVPIGCALGIIGIWGWRQFRTVGYKLIMVGIAISLVIPSSVKISKMINDTYEYSKDIAVIEVEDTATIAEDETVVEEETTEDIITPSTEDNSSKTLWDKLKDAKDNVVDTTKTALSDAADGISEAIEDIGDSIEAKKEQAQRYLEDALEKLVIAIITSCAIPIIVFILMLYIVKIVFGLNIQPVDTVMAPTHKVSEGLLKTGNHLVKRDDND